MPKTAQAATRGVPLLSRRALPLSWFRRPTLEVARDLIGRLLVRRLDDGSSLVARIVETEAYRGEDDLACHAARGRTRRNDPLYRRPGTLYVYFVYGMHWLLNVVTEREGFPAAVLIRAAEPVSGLAGMRARREGRREHELLRGPASLCRALAIDGSLDGALARGAPLHFARGAEVAPARVERSPRIGVAYAGPAADWPWRFALAGSRAVSRRPASERAGRRKPG